MYNQDPTAGSKAEDPWSDLEGRSEFSGYLYCGDDTSLTVFNVPLCFIGTGPFFAALSSLSNTWTVHLSCGYQNGSIAPNLWCPTVNIANGTVSVVVSVIGCCI